MDLMDQIVKGVRNILIKETAFFFLTTFFFFNMNQDAAKILEEKGSLTQGKPFIGKYPNGSLLERNYFVMLTVWTDVESPFEPEEEAILVHYSWVDFSHRYVAVSRLLIS